VDHLIVLIPSFNEINNLKKIINKEFKFLIIDDCSTDGTEKLLKKNKIKYIRNEKKLGYEKSLTKGFKFIIKNFKNIKTICTIDGDNEHPQKKIRKINRFLISNDIDLIVCNRKKQNRLLEKIFSLFFYIKYGIKDPLTGMKFYKVNIIKKFIRSINHKYFLIDLLYLFLRNNYKVKNYKITTRRNLKKSKIGFGLNIQLKILKLFKFLF
tara:strand:- start:8922 stop:9551 length:630 start_codon:yes stop_codon:yes gene_type:complete